MMQHEWEEKERWAGVNCGRRKLWVSAVVFLHLPCHQQTKKLNPRRASSFKSRDVKELRFNASTSELRRVSSRISPRSAEIRASPVHSRCESTPARRDLRGGNTLGYTMATLHSRPRHFQPKAIRVRGSSTFQPREKTGNKGIWPSV